MGGNNGPHQQGSTSMRPSLLKLACIVACCGLLPAVAQQRGQYMPGQYGLNAGILPSPGFTYVDMNVNYNSTTLNDANGNATPVTGSYNVWAIENILYYVPSFKVGGGNLGFMIAFPTLANGDLAIP